MFRSACLLVVAVGLVTACSAGSSATAVLGTGPALTKVNVIADAKDVVAVAFDFPGATPRPLKERTVQITRPTATLAMKITAIRYRGVVCGFSLRGARPTSPVTIRLFGAKQSGALFDSGPVTVSWTNDGTVEAGAAINGGWNFSAEAHPNRGGPGWVVSIGGVAGPTKDAVPKSAGCELTSLTTPFPTTAGPVGYWAGYATV